MSFRQITAGWILPSLLACALILGLAGVGIAGRKDPPSVQAQLKKLELIYQISQRSYVDEVDSNHMFEGAFGGLLQSLDPHSEYLNEDALRDFEVDTEGEFGGLGIQVNVVDGWLTVISPIEDTPAFRAGIQPGDRIVEVEGKSSEGLTTTEAVKVLRGRPGTKVTLTIQHLGQAETESVTITREIIQLKSVKGARMVDGPSGVAYVRVNSFQDRTAKELRDAIEGLMAKGMKALILDLRLNGGGLLEESVLCANLFVRKGAIVSTRGRNPEDNRTEVANAALALPEFPLAVLVNEWSASASEILAGAIKDNRRGIVVGVRTYGKGSVQTLIPLPSEDCAVKLTTARYFTPSGRCIDKRFIRSQAQLESVPPEKREEFRRALDEYGIAPDLEVPLPAGQIADLMESFQDGGARPPAGNGAADTPPGNAESPGGTTAPAKEPFRDVQLERAADALKAVLVMQPERR